MPHSSQGSLNDKVNAVVAVLQATVSKFAPVTFASSLGAEDMVLMDLIYRNLIDIEIFSLDTGRLPEETYSLMSETIRHYGRSCSVYAPESGSVERMVKSFGINGFFESVEARKACCHARKVEPLGRALSGKGAWITGLRANQSTSREAISLSTVDHAHGLQKVNPLFDWSESDVWTYLRENSVPYNALHDRGFPSIGCAPCTRAIQPGEDIRAGRWWWENAEAKECGLHMIDGRLQRVTVGDRG